MHLGTTTAGFVVATFMLSYSNLRPRGGDGTTMMAALTTATAINLGYAWTLGILADRVGKRRVSCAGRVAHVVVAVPLCWLVDTGAFAGIVAGPLLARRREGRPARQRDGVQQCLRS